MIQEASNHSSLRTPPRSTESVSQYRRFKVYLVKPSKYDDDGYVIRYWKGVLPSNTLYCLYGLTEDVRERKVLGADLCWDIRLIDDTVSKVPIKKIIRESRRADTKVLVCLVGVQSNQFLRAKDLAAQLGEADVDVMIGGFHVSGVMATFPEPSPELKELQSHGVTLVAGEVEAGRWEILLRDALSGQLKPLYNFLHEPPDLSKAPLPKIYPALANRYAVSHFATLDCGRGCPFGCTFCTVINVQGRKMRFREVECLIHTIRENYRKHKISFYFFTDDNFCRNKNWESFFDAIIRLHKEENIRIRFNIQVDTKSHLVPHFVEKAALAGCTQVFIGMESLNEENLKSVGKSQNQTGAYRELIDAYHQVGIVTHLAYIIGFPFDTVESVRKDLERLRSLHSAQASFFMMTPLPGSVDYRNVRERKMILDADLNNYDTFHETHRHPNMSPGEWSSVYEEAWKGFYSVDHMKTIMRQTTAQNYWGVFMIFIWYKNAVQVEGGHPMLHGFVRLKGRRERRLDYPIESLTAYWKRRGKDCIRTLKGWAKLLMDMEEVWLATRVRSPLEEKVVHELVQLQKKASGWRHVRLEELHCLYQKAASQLARSHQKDFFKVRIPSQFQLWLNKWNLFHDSLIFTRQPLKLMWREAYERFKRGKIFSINYIRLFAASLRESFLCARFLSSMSKASDVRKSS